MGKRWEPKGAKHMGQATVCMVPSKSRSGLYHFLMRFHGSNLVVCSCEGYAGRQTCHHVQEEADDHTTATR